MRVLISGGGTGGHLFPAIAVAQALSRKDPSARILFVGRQGGIEQQVVPRYGIDFTTVVAAKVDMEEQWRNWKVPLVMPAALFQAWRLMRRFRPQVVLGTGGYVSAPLIVTAATMRIPVVLQEQNCLPGRTTRLLARLAKAVAIAYPESAGYLDGRPTFVTGTPVRPEFQAGRAAFPEHPARVLVLGGSQGAHRINLAIAESVSRLLASSPIEIEHQTGPADLAALEAARQELSDEARSRYRPFAFADDLPRRLQQTDLVISRAGASTISEASALGIPMVLIPGPFAGGHQRYNARPFVEAGAAIVIANEDCDGAHLLERVAPILEDTQRYAGMVTAMRSLGRPHAADDVVSILQRVALH